MAGLTFMTVTRHVSCLSQTRPALRGTVLRAHADYDGARRL